jgi:membrane protease YdiL (CAAX protease family)
MTAFHAYALAGVAIWLLAVALWFRRSTPVLVGGLALAGLGAVGAVHVTHTVTPEDLGLTHAGTWTHVFLYALGGLGVMLAWSPVADRIATRFVAKPPTLGAFKALQQSVPKLLAGIVIAWVLGGILEELVLRGIVEQAVEGLGAQALPRPLAAGLGIAAAAGGAAILHLYQGPRAVIIITQLSVLFGLVFVLSGHNLWAVILCHGLYDTIAFVRFAMGWSRYSKTEG